jgi:trypsin
MNHIGGRKKPFPVLPLVTLCLVATTLATTTDNDQKHLRSVVGVRRREAEEGSPTLEENAEAKGGSFTFAEDLTPENNPRSLEEGGSGPSQAVVPGTMSRIINGTESEAGRYPYLAALYAKEYYGTSQNWCGGTLIAPSVVLTAAHCTALDEVDEVVLGVHNLSNYDYIDRNNTAVEFHTIQRRVIHPFYDNNKVLDYDFALLFLDRPASASCAPVGLVNDNTDLPMVGEIVTTMRWGVTNYETFEFANVTMEVDINIISDRDCLAKYEGYFDRESMMCAHGEGKDACQGDSGGPLVKKGLLTDGSYDTLYGVTSWGIMCATEKPGVYAKVSTAYDWIMSEMSEKR